MVKENYIDDKGNSIELRKDSRGRWATQNFSFVDENGNNIEFDLQNSSWIVGFPELGQKQEFEGYMVFPGNVRPAGENLDAAYNKIYADAQRYFDEHPEQRPGDGYSREVSYTTKYLKIQAFNYLRSRAAEGKSSSLEEVALHAEDHPDRDSCYCWEQIVGKMSADASDEDVIAALEHDQIHETMKQDSKAMAESIQRGTESIKNRVAEAQNARYTIRTNNRGDRRVMTVTTQETSSNKTLTEDEKNAVVSWYVSKKINGK